MTVIILHLATTLYFSKLNVSEPAHVYPPAPARSGGAPLHLAPHGEHKQTALRTRISCALEGSACAALHASRRVRQSVRVRCTWRTPCVRVAPAGVRCSGAGGGPTPCWTSPPRSWPKTSRSSGSRSATTGYPSRCSGGSSSGPFPGTSETYACTLPCRECPQ